MTRIGSLFSGYGGLDMAVEEWTGGTTVWHCEIGANPSKILAARWPGTPNLTDITAVDWTAVPPVDVICGGFPCQDLSMAGIRRGLRPGTRSGLWQYMAEAIRTLLPRTVVIENVKGILSAGAHSDLERQCWCVGDPGEQPLRALGAVLGDLADLGYDAEWGTVPASWAGAPHRRERVFILAHRQDEQRPAGTGTAAPFTDPVTLLPTLLASGWNEQVQRPEYGLNLGTALRSLFPTLKATNNENEQRAEYGLNLGRTVFALPPGGFGSYQQAVDRWERTIGRPAPPPVTARRDGGPRLNAVFAEWIMGLPEGWVTGPDIGLPHTAQLHALGNGVVPQQALLALQILSSATI
jgi:DNA (cytosine-5)-methyltransferase 1